MTCPRWRLATVMGLPLGRLPGGARQASPGGRGAISATLSPRPAEQDAAGRAMTAAAVGRGPDGERPGRRWVTQRRGESLQALLALQQSPRVITLQTAGPGAAASSSCRSCCAPAPRRHRSGPGPARVLPLVAAVVRRSAYLVLLLENRPALAELVALCGASPWIAEQLARHPVLLDELLDRASLYTRRTRSWRDRVAPAGGAAWRSTTSRRRWRRCATSRLAHVLRVRRQRAGRSPAADAGQRQADLDRRGDPGAGAGGRLGRPDQ